MFACCLLCVVCCVLFVVRCVRVAGRGLLFAVCVLFGVFVTCSLLFDMNCWSLVVVCCAFVAVYCWRLRMVVRRVVCCALADDVCCRCLFSVVWRLLAV